MASDSSALLRLSMQRVSTHTHSMIPVFLRLLAGIDYLLIAEATTDFILLLLIHLGKVDHLSVINFCGVNTPCSFADDLLRLFSHNIYIYILLHIFRFYRYIHGSISMPYFPPNFLFPHCSLLDLLGTATPEQNSK